MKAPNTTPQIPSRDDHGTTTCPVCRRVFTPTGRQAYCSTACRKTAFRRRHHQPGPAVTIPAVRPRREFTVYECPGCGERQLGEQRAAKPAAPSPAGSASAVHAHIAMSPWP